MQKVENTLARKLPFWPLLGPILLLPAVALLFFQAPEMAFLFALVSMAGLGLCWRWTWRGLGISSILLILTFVYYFISLTHREVIWHSGMMLAFLLAFLTTALSAEETKEHFDAIASDPEAALSHMKEQMQQQVQTVRQLEEQIQRNREAFAQQRDYTATQELMLQQVRDELVALRKEDEQRQQELTKRSQSLSRLQEQMAEASSEAMLFKEEMKVQKERYETSLNILKRQLEQHDLRWKAKQLEEEKLNQEMLCSKAQAEGQTRRASFLEEEKLAMQRAWDQESKRASQLEEELQHIRGHETKLVSEIKEEMQRLREHESKRVSVLEEELQCFRQQELKHISQLEELQRTQEQKSKRISELEECLREQKAKEDSLQEQELLAEQDISVEHKEPSWQEFRKAQGLYEQLREQFEQKSCVLDAARKERFQAEEMAQKLQRELDELARYNFSIDEASFRRHLKLIEREHTQTVEVLETEIDGLYGLVSHLLKEFPKGSSFNNMQMQS